MASKVDIISSLAQKIDSVFSVSDESSAATILVISASPNPEVVYADVYNEKMSSKWNPIIQSNVETLKTEQGHDVLMKTISKSAALKNYSQNMKQLLQDFPSIKKFVDFTMDSPTKEAMDKILSPVNMMQLFMSLSRPNFFELFEKMKMDEKLKYDTQKRVLEYTKKKEGLVLTNKEMTKLIQVIFNT